MWRIASDAAETATRFRLDTGGQTTILYDVHDRPVFTLYTEQRMDVPLARVSPHLVAAVLAAEDRRFFQHHGYDLGRVIAAGLANLRAGRLVQGGSTITQQLVRMTNGERDRTVSRKLREMFTAAAVERRFTKTAILETYLNKVYLGEGFYGVEAAAEGYYATSAMDVTPEEAATLAALIQSPSRYTHDDLAAHVRARRNWILDAMYRDGRLDELDYLAAVDAPLRMTASSAGPNARRDGDTRAAMPAGLASRDNDNSGLYFKEAVRRELMSRLPPSDVLSAGLRVYTTIDPAMQVAAEQALLDQLTAIERAAAAKRTNAPPANVAGAKPLASADDAGANEGRAGESRALQASARFPPLQGALVAIDPTTGYVGALVGGRDFAESSFDRARQARRQPGSAFKPFVYATALELGYEPGTILRDLDQPVPAPGGGYLPRGEHEAAEMTVRQALVVSSNRAAVHTLQRVGLSSFLHNAQRFGFTSPLPVVPSLALGTGEVSLLELTSAFGVFANRGEYVEPTLIRRIESAQGEVIYRARPETRFVVGEDTAYLMTNMLADVIDRGTGTAVRRLGFRAPAAGKTGTTDGVADAWFVGYTPRLAAGVWIGYDDPRAIRKGAFASTIAVPVWAAFAKAATAGEWAQSFERPGSIERVAYCPLSGEPAGPWCQGGAHGPRMTIVVSTNPITGTISATSVPARDDLSAPRVYYDLARRSDTTRCTLHTESGRGT